MEKVHTFGEEKGLLGIVTVPDAPRPEAPAVVILNAGLVHRAGPFRMSVEIARRLAKLGFVVLRFDQSSMGDSHNRKGNLPYDEVAVLDGREALDFLAERYEARRFIAMGLCNGAINAHRLALADERVVGACLLDGYAYRTPGYWRHMLLPRIVDANAWRNAGNKLRERLQKHLGGASPSPTAGHEPGATVPLAERPGDTTVDIFTQDWAPIEAVRRDLIAILDRGTRMLFIYTGGWSDYVFADQFYEMFPDLPHRDRARVVFMGEADHTYMLHEHREALMRDIDGFAQSFAR